MIELLFFFGMQWTGLFLEHALGLYGLLTSIVFMSIGVGDEKRKWLLMAHLVIVSLCADVMFGRTLGITAVVYGAALVVWSYVARLSRARFFAFIALGMLVSFFLESQREHLIRVLFVLLAMWVVMRSINFQTKSQEIVLK